MKKHELSKQQLQQRIRLGDGKGKERKEQQTKKRRVPYGREGKRGGARGDSWRIEIEE